MTNRLLTLINARKTETEEAASKTQREAPPIMRQHRVMYPFTQGQERQPLDAAKHGVSSRWT